MFSVIIQQHMICALYKCHAIWIRQFTLPSSYCPGLIPWFRRLSVVTKVCGVKRQPWPNTYFNVHVCIDLVLTMSYRPLQVLMNPSICSLLRQRPRRWRRPRRPQSVQRQHRSWSIRMRHVYALLYPLTPKKWEYNIDVTDKDTYIILYNLIYIDTHF